jgi:hypothetical protein
MNQEESHVEGINDLNRINNARQNGFDLANTQFTSASARSLSFSASLASPRENGFDPSMTPCQMGSVLRLQANGFEFANTKFAVARSAFWHSGRHFCAKASTISILYG